MFYPLLWKEIESRREIYRKEYFKLHPDKIPVKYVRNPHELIEEDEFSENIERIEKL